MPTYRTSNKKRYVRSRIVSQTHGMLVRNRFGTFTMGAYEIAQGASRTEHLVLYSGIDFANIGQRLNSNPFNASALSGSTRTGKSVQNHPLVRLHSACYAGDIFEADRCDCRWQLEMAMRMIASDGFGVVIHALNEEARGNGLAVKIQSCSLMDKTGCSTAVAFNKLRVPLDRRSVCSAATILKSMKLHDIRLMTNNPLKIEGLQRAGIRVHEVVPLVMDKLSPELVNYLRSKRDELGHLIPERI